MRRQRGVISGRCLERGPDGVWSSARGSPAGRRSDRLPLAHELRERLPHRYVVPGVTDRQRDFIARSRLVSEHALDAAGEWHALHVWSLVINAPSATILPVTSDAQRQAANAG